MPEATTPSPTSTRPTGYGPIQAVALARPVIQLAKNPKVQRFVLHSIGKSVAGIGGLHLLTAVSGHNAGEGLLPFFMPARRAKPTVEVEVPPMWLRDP